MPTTSARAEVYRLIDNKDDALCRRFHHYFNSYGRIPDTYEWPEIPSEPDFKKPKWEVIDISPRMDLIHKLYLTMQGAALTTPPWNFGDPEVNRSAANRLRTFQRWVKEGVARLERTVIDLGNDGSAEIIYRLRREVITDLVSPPAPGRVLGWDVFPDVDENFELWKLYWTHLDMPSDVVEISGQTFILSPQDFRGGRFTVGVGKYVASDHRALTYKSTCIFEATRE